MALTPTTLSAPRWLVLMLVTGRGNEPLRGVVGEKVRELGFSFRIYDEPGYPVDPSVHAHEACVRAIFDHDIIIAVLDENEGSQFNTSVVSPNLVMQLREMGVLPHRDSRQPVPTVTEVEVLTARAAGKSVLLFVDEEALRKADQLIELLTNGAVSPRPRHDHAPSWEPLAREAQWAELVEHYDLPNLGNVSARHLLFIQRIRQEAPNYITSFDRREAGELAESIGGRLAGVAYTLVRGHAESARIRLGRARGPLAFQSLSDLRRDHLIVEPPYELVSGELESAGAPLFDVKDHEPKALANSLESGASILLLGDPGQGKSTVALLAFIETTNTPAAQRGEVLVLFASLRDVPVPTGEAAWTADLFLRTILTLPFSRAPWPEGVTLPNGPWLLVLDGADESRLSGEDMERVLHRLPAGSRILLSCRAGEFERYYARTRGIFDSIVRLTAWKPAQINEYAYALNAAGKKRAARVVRQAEDDPSAADFLSIPLWLSLLSYLAERGEGSAGFRSALRVRGPAELLRAATAAVVEDEARRHELSLSEAERLPRIWSELAYRIQYARRARTRLEWFRVAADLGIEPGSKLERSVLTVLDVFDGELLGFFHEVFLEYWLAEYLVDRLTVADTPPKEAAAIFSFHRSYATNRFMRDRIRIRENASEITKRLRASFDEAHELGDRASYTRNQLVYLIARIDPSVETQNFVRRVWRDEPHEFVRYAAAFSAAILGDHEVESAYYLRLRQTPTADEINRAYHLSYYGDAPPIDESAANPIDDGTLDASQTLARLFARLRRNEPRHRNLRRIELFTIRRFLETGRRVPRSVDNPIEIIEAVRSELAALPHSDFRDSALEEVDAVVALLRESAAASR